MTYTCPYCQTQFRWKATFYNHMQGRNCKHRPEQFPTSARQAMVKAQQPDGGAVIGLGRHLS